MGGGIGGRQYWGGEAVLGGAVLGGMTVLRFWVQNSQSRSIIKMFFEKIYCKHGMILTSVSLYSVDLKNLD